MGDGRVNRPQWPTIQDYVDWAESRHCTVEIEPARGEQRLMMITIVAPSGASVIELVEAMTDPLMSTSVARLDRRLGVKSYLFE
jgi:hypothetical protein